MDVATLQRRLMALGLDTSGEDGIFGPRTRAAVLKALTDGPDWKLEQSDVEAAAAELRLPPALVWAVYDVESTGASFIEGRPTILFEPHRFSRATDHRYDATHPRISSLRWNRRLYPGSQSGRWEQLLDAVALDVDAGFASASYGGFQILGENHLVCGAATPWSFAWQQAQTESDQLNAFLFFISSKRVDDRKLVDWLRGGRFDRFAEGYNGTAYRENQYDLRLARAAQRRGVTDPSKERRA